MNKSLLSLAVISALSLGFTGCGSSSSDTPADTSTDVEVERGKVFDATVTDSSNPALTATRTTGSNIYKFASTPTYPIKVNGGWIDVDGDGEMTTEDIALDIEMTSYSNVVTPITTYISDSNETIREQRMAQLMSDMNITSQTELLKPPSKAQNNTIFLANAIFKAMKENNTTDLSNNFTDINSSFSNLKETFTVSGSQATQTPAGIAKWMEEQTVTELVNDGKLSKFTQNYITSNTTSSGDDTIGSSDDTQTDSDNQDSSDNTLTNNICETKKDFIFGTITSSVTGKVWIDRNLGSSKICTSLDDSSCYGDYYQWGRCSDGHEEANSSTTTVKATSVSQIGHGDFIVDSKDWTSADTDGAIRNNAWNPCPVGYRIPTLVELKAEKFSSLEDAYTKLKLPAAGVRDAFVSLGDFEEQGTYGNYWSSTMTNVLVVDSDGYGWAPSIKSTGNTIRCISN